MLFWETTLGGKTLIPADNLYQYAPWSAYRTEQGVPDLSHNMLVSDLLLENYQWKLLIREALGRREVPLWNPHLFAGVPFLAAGQHSALYPFSLIYYMFPLESAYGWFTVSQLGLAGVLMYLFLRGLGVGRVAALFAGVGYQFSAFLVISVVFQMVLAAAVWLPFLLLMCEFVIQQRPIGGRPTGIVWVAGGAFGLAMCIFAGHAEFVYYSLLVMGAWSGWRLIGVWRGGVAFRAVVGRGLSLLGLVALGIGIGAIQAIPFYELAGRNFREGSASFAEVQSYAYPLRHALAFLMPNFFGNPTQHTYFDLFTGSVRAFAWSRADQSRVTDTFWQVGKNYVEGACYVGILTLFFAGIGATERRKPYRLFLLLLSLLCVTFIFGTPTYALLYYGLPGVNQLHSPFRWVWPLTIALHVLAGFGVQRIIDHPTILTRRLCVLVGGLGSVIVIGGIASRVAFDPLRSMIERVWQSLAGAETQFPNVEVFYSVLLPNVLILGGVLLASGLALWLMQRGGRWSFAVILVLIADLWIASGGFNPAANPAWLHFQPPLIRFLTEQNPSTWRYITVDDGSHPLNANLGMKYGLNDVAGYDSVIPKQYVDHLRRAYPQGMLLYNRIAPLTWNAPEKIVDLGKIDPIVRYVVSPLRLTLPDLTQVFEDRGVFVYERSGWVKQMVKSASLIEFTYALDTPTNSFVFYQSYYPGWRAYFRATGSPDELELTIRLHDQNFMAVSPPAQPGAIRFRFSPPSFQIGAFVSFVSAVTLIFMLLVYGWRRFTGNPGRESGEDVQRVARNSIAPIFLSLFNRGLDFAFAVIQLRVMSPTEAGSYAYAVVIIGWFDILTNFGLNTLLTREIAKAPHHTGRLLRQTSLFRMALTLAWLPVLGGFFLVRQGLGGDPLNGETVIAILLLYLSLIPGSLNSGLSALFYGLERAEIPAVLSTVTSILSVSVRLGTLLLGWGVIGLAGASLFLNLCTLVLLGQLAWRLLSTEQKPVESAITPYYRNKTEFKGLSTRVMLSEGFPLMLNHLLATLFFKIDIVILEQLKGSAVVAQYATSYKWVDAIGVIPAFFTMAMLPLMSRLAHSDRANLAKTYQLAVKLLFMLALPIAVLTTFTAPILIGLLGGDRYLIDGTRALQLMIWFIPIGWINSLTQYVLIALDQQRALRFPFLAGVSFNIIANLVLIPRFSYEAAAITTIFSELVLQIGFYWLLRKEIGDIEWMSVLGKPLIAGGIMLGAMVALTQGGGGGSLMLILSAILGGGVYLCGLWVVRPFTLEEQSRLAPLLPSRVRSTPPPIG
jgi:O-antigen/teichoic acid export membrane protein